MAEEQEIPTPEQVEQNKRMLYLAATIGFNELARMAKTLGDKVFYRLKREALQEEFIKAGGHVLFNPAESLCEITVPGSSLAIRFTAQDIQLMRQTLKEWDESEQGQPEDT